MTRHIHFCNVGKLPEPPLAVCQSRYPKDKVYLVNSGDKDTDDEYTRNEDVVRSRLEAVGITDIETIQVDPYDFEAVTEALEKAVRSEREKHRDCRFHFNMTAGTNISAGAMCALALSMKDADLYHLRDGSYCRPPSDRPLLVYVELADMESVNMLESKPMEASIMELLRDGPIPHCRIMETFPDKGPSLISYHMNNSFPESWTIDSDHLNHLL